MTKRQANAINRAQELELWRTVEGGTDGHYMVDSTSERGRWYFVDVTPSGYRCECKAGQAGTPCVHAAAVYIVIHGLAGWRVKEPAAPEHARPFAGVLAPSTAGRDRMDLSGLEDGPGLRALFEQRAR